MVQTKTAQGTDWKITVRLPRALRQPAQEKARRTKRSLNRLIADAVQREVERPEPAYANERERVLVVLKESGLLDEPWGADWYSPVGSSPPGANGVPLRRDSHPGTFRIGWRLRRGAPSSHAQHRRCTAVDAESQEAAVLAFRQALPARARWSTRVSPFLGRGSISPVGAGRRSPRGTKTQRGSTSVIGRDVHNA
jgi:hypothetical protein